MYNPVVFALNILFKANHDLLFSKLIAHVSCSEIEVVSSTCVKYLAVFDYIMFKVGIVVEYTALHAKGPWIKSRRYKLVSES